MNVYLFSTFGAAAGISTEFLLNPVYRIERTTLRNNGFCYPCRKAFSYSIAGAIGFGVAAIAYKLWSNSAANRIRTSPSPTPASRSVQPTA